MKLFRKRRESDRTSSSAGTQQVADRDGGTEEEEECVWTGVEGVFMDKPF